MPSANTEPRKKIIYVDDMNVSLMVLKRSMEAHYEIFLAESTEKMYKILEKVRPDLILLDINMPYVDGYTTIKKLKEDERYADIPVIFITSNNEKESVLKGLSLGAAAYAIKPFNALKLVETINNQLYPREGSIAGKGVKPGILVVDDMASILRTMHHALHDKYHVFLLSRSDAVIDFLHNKKPDLIFLDYLMPGLSGFDLIPKIRELPNYKLTPIIIITTEGTLKNVNEAILLGASDFIVKPFDMQELTSKLETHLKRAGIHTENTEIDVQLE